MVDANGVLSRSFDEDNNALRVTLDPETLAWNPAPIVKPTDQTINNDAVLDPDSALTFSIAADESWVGTLVIFVVGNGTADFEYAITAPSGASGIYGSHGPRDADGIMEASSLATSFGTAIAIHGSNASGNVITVFFQVSNGATAGSITLTWAQDTATVGDTTVKAGSYLIRRRVA